MGPDRHGREPGQRNTFNAYTGAFQVLAFTGMWRRFRSESVAVRLPPYAAAQIADFLAEHLFRSAFWDKRYGLWRVTDDNPDSDPHAESRDADTVIKYMRANS